MVLYHSLLKTMGNKLLTRDAVLMEITSYRTVETIRRPGGASDLADASAFVRESSDDTILAALDHHSADDAGCAEGGSCEETIIEIDRSAIVNVVDDGGC